MGLLTAQASVLLSLFVCHVGSVGEFTSPPLGGVQHERQYTTIQIPWKLNDYGEFSFINYAYKKSGSPADQWRDIFIVKSDGSVNIPSNTDQFKNRLEFKGDLRNNLRIDATLMIKDFMKQDEGDFRCSVRGPVPLVRVVAINAVVLSNITKFKAVNPEKDDGSDVVQNDNITLSCTTTMGEPSPTVEIRKDDKRLNHSTVSNARNTTLLYHLNPVTKDDRGSYTCRVITDNDYISVKNLVLQVKYPPEIDTTVKSKLSGCLGKPFSIDCTASGDPKPDVRIVGPNGEALAPEKEFVLKDFGIYRCEAKSSLGNDSLNITVGRATKKPEQPSFSGECKFTRLSWKESSDRSVKYTLQVREMGSSGPWGDITTSSDTAYSPSTNNSLSKNKDYEFRVVAKNCVGSTVSEVCNVEGENLSTGARSSDSNTGVIAGSVIGVLVVILIIVIVAIYCHRKRKRESPSIRLKKSEPITNVAKPNPKQGGLLYSDSPNMDARVPPPAGYRQDGDDDEDDDDEFDDDHNDGSTLSNNVPSWV
ncbi:contactin-1a-like [Dendronephthya gigantea]|uniref:contactin-1a-like n=1 Tax=Dendronephthya gigantea TaxID=151771 RepID=UPI00106B0145|nr:contactin-1a-like [Dendronephthya gigantea]